MRSLVPLLVAIGLGHAPASAWKKYCRADELGSAWDKTASGKPRRCKAPDSVMALPTRDVHIDRENRNCGLGSEFILKHDDALGLLGFDSLPRIPGRKQLIKAELTMHGWGAADGDARITLELVKTIPGWTEGTGHWYAFAGGRHNNYAAAYSEFPEYVPPANTSNPAEPTGIVWDSSDSLRAGLVPIAIARAVIPRGNPWGSYPRIEHTGLIAFDLTAFFNKPENRVAPVSLGIRRAAASEGPNESFAWIYSKDHVYPEIYAPKLTLWYR